MERSKRHLERQAPSEAATYQIRVLGTLGEKWSDWFNGMTIALETGSDGSSITTFLELTDLLNPGGQVGGLAAIAEDGYGELYLVDRDGTTNGEIYKIIPDPTGVAPPQGSTRKMHLGWATPNPFAARTEMELAVYRQVHVTVEVFNAAGQPVRTIMSEAVTPGTHRLQWDGRNDRGHELPSGVYFLRADVGGQSSTRKVSLVR